MTKLIIAAFPFAALAAGCLQSSPPVGGVASQLAKACAIATDVAIDALEPGFSIPEVAVDHSPAECDDEPLGAACCDSADPDDCTPMDLPPDSCYTLPDVPDAEIVYPIAVVTVDHTTTQYYDTCEDPPDDTTCNEESAAYVLQPYPHVRYAIATDKAPVDGVIATRLYYLPEGTFAARTEHGEQLFPLLEEDDGFADLTNKVPTPAGDKYVDKQNDCVPRPNGCGFTCTPC